MSDSVHAIRRGEKVVAVVETAAGCSASAEPKVSFSKRAVTLGMQLREKGQQVAACLCARRYEFTLAQPVRKGTVLYFVKDGDGVAHTIAP